MHLVDKTKTKSKEKVAERERIRQTCAAPRLTNVNMELKNSRVQGSSSAGGRFVNKSPYDFSGFHDPRPLCTVVHVVHCTKMPPQSQWELTFRPGPSPQA